MNYRHCALLCFVRNQVNISAVPTAKDQLFQAINTIMGNLKRYLLGIHHAI